MGMGYFGIVVRGQGQEQKVVDDLGVLVVLVVVLDYLDYLDVLVDNADNADHQKRMMERIMDRVMMMLMGQRGRD